jgi:hypothetical protein
MAHPESAETGLSDSWDCVLNWLIEKAPLTEWPLWALYRPDILADVSADCKWRANITPSLMNRLTAAYGVTFAGRRELGHEPCGLELFGALVGQGYDPGLTDSHKDIVSEFCRNVDNWVRLSISTDSLCSQRLSPMIR